MVKNLLVQRDRRVNPFHHEHIESALHPGDGFRSIAAMGNTSLQVVAPGIAEALFATAIGLVAAIPATIFYNKFSSEVNKQAQRLEGFADEFSAILSRQIDERG